MASILVSYRRTDASIAAGWIAQSLKARLGSGNVFIDIDNMPPGRDFREHLRKTLDGVDVVLAVIGPNWLAIDSETQRSRLEDENDWVRIEISTALARPDVLVIPVVVDGGSLPKPQQLPQAVKDLAFRSGLVFRNDDFGRNLERLVEFLENEQRHAAGTADPRPIKLGNQPSEDTRTRLLHYIIGGVALLGAVAALAATGRQLWDHAGKLVSSSEPLTPPSKGETASSRAPHALETTAPNEIASNPAKSNAAETPLPSPSPAIQITPSQITPSLTFSSIRLEDSYRNLDMRFNATNVGKGDQKCNVAIVLRHANNTTSLQGSTDRPFIPEGKTSYLISFVGVARKDVGGAQFSCGQDTYKIDIKDF